MPCRDDYDGRPGADALRFERMLCALCTTIEHGSIDKDFTALKTILDSVDWADVNVTRNEFENWWERHKMEDRARRKLEDEKRNQDALIESARAKMTPEEREAMDRSLGKNRLLPW